MSRRTYWKDDWRWSPVYSVAQTLNHLSSNHWVVTSVNFICVPNLTRIEKPGFLGPAPLPCTISVKGIPPSFIPWLWSFFSHLVTLIQVCFVTMSSFHISSDSCNLLDSQDTTYSISSFTISVYHHRLIITNLSSIRSFLIACDQYYCKITGRVKLLATGADAADKTNTTKSNIPIDLEYSIHATHFSSCIALGFIEYFASRKSLTSPQLRV